MHTGYHQLQADATYLAYLLSLFILIADNRSWNEAECPTYTSPNSPLL